LKIKCFPGSGFVYLTSIILTVVLETSPPTKQKENISCFPRDSHRNHTRTNPLTGNTRSLRLGHIKESPNQTANHIPRFCNLVADLFDSILKPEEKKLWWNMLSD